MPIPRFSIGRCPLRSEHDFLFCAQRRQGIDLRGPARGPPAGEERHEEQHRGRAAILYPGREVGRRELAGVIATDASARPPSAHEDAALHDRLAAFERELIERTLDACDGSIADAARRLQTDRANLYRRMKRLGIER
jgi:two-component system nitrogen regulation response regulator NtrX